jgi:hypothetical protein
MGGYATDVKTYINEGFCKIIIATNSLLLATLIL